MKLPIRLIGAAAFVAAMSGLLIALSGPAGDGPAPAVWAAQQEGSQATPADQELPPGIKARTPTGQTAAEAIAAHMVAVEGPEQPIPFSHRFHSQELLMQCEYCHGGTDESVIAVIPPVELCWGCHRIVGAQLEPIQRLRGYWERGEPIEWKRVYKTPDFVQFPHRAHIRAQVECEECHGEVAEMDRVYKFASLKNGLVSRMPLGGRRGHGRGHGPAADREVSAAADPGGTSASWAVSARHRSGVRGEPRSHRLHSMSLLRPGSGSE